MNEVKINLPANNYQGSSANLQSMCYRRSASSSFVIAVSSSSAESQRTDVCTDICSGASEETANKTRCPDTIIRPVDLYMSASGHK